MSARTTRERRCARSAAPIAVLALTLACEIDLERMLDQHKAEPFEASPFFADGQAMRAPPAGTVPTTRLTGPVELRSGRNASGEYVSTLPVPLDAALLERGQDRFRIFCRTCHGALGDGQSPVADAQCHGLQLLGAGINEDGAVVS